MKNQLSVTHVLLVCLVLFCFFIAACRVYAAVETVVEYVRSLADANVDYYDGNERTI